MINMILNIFNIFDSRTWEFRILKNDNFRRKKKETKTKEKNQFKSKGNNSIHE